MSDEEEPPSSVPSDAPTPRSELVTPSTTNFRLETLQSAIDVTQKRPSFVLPIDAVPPSAADPSSTPDRRRDRLDTFVAVMGAATDRIAAGQTRFLVELKAILGQDIEQEEDARKQQTNVLRAVERNLRILIAVGVVIVALGCWLAGQRSASSTPIVVTPHQAN